MISEEEKLRRAALLVRRFKLFLSRIDDSDMRINELADGARHIVVDAIDKLIERHMIEAIDARVRRGETTYAKLKFVSASLCTSKFYEDWRGNWVRTAGVLETPRIMLDIGRNSTDMLIGWLDDPRLVEQIVARDGRRRCSVETGLIELGGALACIDDKRRKRKTHAPVAGRRVPKARQP